MIDLCLRVTSTAAWRGTDRLPLSGSDIVRNHLGIRKHSGITCVGATCEVPVDLESHPVGASEVIRNSISRTTILLIFASENGKVDPVYFRNFR
ncbi:hypothetical protein J6590_000978 [Homalodisca vitripennis]|nr:hypothetical protein J6590_000978 [Homalodisca vitripennis]